MLWPNGSKTRPNISSPFGPRKSPTAGASSQHRGTDFTGYATVRAIAPGTVVAVGTPAGWSGGGTQVWVQHEGFLTRSLHLVQGSPVVKVGQRVSEGQALGAMGKTGTATGVHHHLEVVVGGTQVDPVPFITSRISGPASGFSQEVANQQAYLNAAQGERLAVDGIRGANTIAAYKRYQQFLKGRGWYSGAIDGVWGSGTQAGHEHRYAEWSGQQSAPKTGALSYADIQRGLNKFGYGLAVDDIWGPRSSNALADFQRRNGLKVDRIVGPQTRAKLGI